jgi:hypothetical protein
MIPIFVTLWTLLVFGSIAWYAFLLFYVGWKGGKEFRQMTRKLSERTTERHQQKSD